MPVMQLNNSVMTDAMNILAIPGNEDKNGMKMKIEITQRAEKLPTHHMNQFHHRILSRINDILVMIETRHRAQHRSRKRRILLPKKYRINDVSLRTSTHSAKLPKQNPPVLYEKWDEHQ